MHRRRQRVSFVGRAFRLLKNSFSGKSFVREAAFHEHPLPFQRCTRIDGSRSLKSNPEQRGIKLLGKGTEEESNNPCLEVERYE
ncbi:hypothetical protein TNIN_140531 [Trichonephila inaurata madagascariensis]|uniref:Uncharacterized protein n=1 Tax=Trichonephila inaurata madagascariensis TaxID=2747483 RepID=A0A8X6JCS7_9ARAC|nr:hypothetical protein TNIN_140531 [Trichonephila inaurata madagascariensis]